MIWTARRSLQLYLLLLLGSLSFVAANTFGQSLGSRVNIPKGPDPTLKKAKGQPTAKIKGMLASYDELFRDTERGYVDLIGRVQILHKGQLLQAQRVRIWDKLKKIDLEGDVSLATAQYTIEADRVQMDYDTGLGWIEDGVVRAGPIEFSGRRIKKLGENHYDVLEAEFTSCTNCPPTWSFSGSSIDATIGGYAFLKNTFMRIGGVPVFWLPYLVLPLKNDRQTGLLPPEFLVSQSSGNSIALPFFWAINSSQDATITFLNYEKRGPKGRLNYRYLVNPTSGGELSAALMQDRAFTDEPRYQAFHGENGQSTRWFVKYEHYLDLPGGYVQRTEINNASDLQYPRDFASETQNDGSPAMENRISITKNNYTEHYSIEADYFIHMLQSDPLAGNDMAVHKFPEFRYETSPQPLGLGYYTLNFNYANFNRAGPGHDDLRKYTDPYFTDPATCTATGDCKPKNICTINDPVQCALCDTVGWETRPFCKEVQSQYNPHSDMIRTGQRFDFQPSWYYPIQLGRYVDMVPRLTYRESLYYFNVGDDRSNTRRYLRTDLNLRTQVSSVYNDMLFFKGSRVKHEIVPELHYTGTPWVDHKSHPFFGFEDQSQAPIYSRDSIKDLDLQDKSNLQFDYYDRIYDRSLFTFALANRLIQKKYQNGKVEFKQVASLAVAQSYDASGKSPYPWSDLSTILDLRFDQFQTYSIFNYYPEQDVTSTSIRLKLLNPKGNFLEFVWNKQYTLKAGQKEVGRPSQDYGFNLGVVSKYVDAVGQVMFDGNWETTSAASSPVKSWGLLTALKPPGDCWLIGLTMSQNVDRDLELKMNFEFSFDGTPRPPPNPDALNDIYNIGI